jgi:hypothetical protein
MGLQGLIKNDSLIPEILAFTVKIIRAMVVGGGRFASKRLPLTVNHNHSTV